MTDSASPRLPSLTGMRFLAALAVVLIHVGGGFAHAPWLLTAESYGYVGVSFFFVLSGFVLTWSSGRRSAPRFWWLRFARIYPTQLAVALFAFGALAAQEQIPSGAGRAADLLLFQAWSTHQDVYYGGNGVSWSLSAEAFFYALFPLAIVLVRRLRGPGLAATAGITVATLAIAPLMASSLGMSASTYSWAFFVFPPYRFGEFLLGMLLCRAMQCGLRVPAPNVSFLAALAAAGGLTWWMVVHVGLPRPFVALAYLPVFALMLAAGAAADLRGRRTWTGSAWLVRLGEWSFALYLVHKPVYLLTSRWGWWGAPTGAVAPVVFAVYLAAAVLVAACVHHAIEKPVERLLRRVPVRSGDSATPGARVRGGGPVRSGLRAGGRRVAPAVAGAQAGDGLRAEVARQRGQGFPDLGQRGRVVGAERGGQHRVDRRRAHRRDPVGDPCGGANQQPAPVGGVAAGLDGTGLAQAGDARGHLALREAGALGDLADRAVRVGPDVAGHDQDRPGAGGPRSDTLGRDRLFADLHQRPAEQEQLHRVHGVRVHQM